MSNKERIKAVVKKHYPNASNRFITELLREFETIKSVQVIKLDLEKDNYTASTISDTIIKGKQ